MIRLCFTGYPMVLIDHLWTFTHPEGFRRYSVTQLIFATGPIPQDSSQVALFLVFLIHSGPHAQTFFALPPPFNYIFVYSPAYHIPSCIQDIC